MATSPRAPRESDCFIRYIRNSGDEWGMYREEAKEEGVDGRIFFFNSKTGISSWKPPRLSLHVELRKPKKKEKAVGKKGEGVDKKEEVQRKVEKEELMNKVDRGERVTQLRDKTSGVLDQIFQTIKKEENLDKNEEIINRRTERNFDETKERSVPC